MNIGKSITFVFDDKRWLEKVLIGGLITLAGMILFWTIVAPFLASALILGYMIDVLRNVRRGDPQPLPEWNEWGDKLVKGLKYMLITLIWALPVILIWFPFSLVAIIFGDTNLDGLVALAGLAVSCFSVLYSIALIVIMPAFTVRFAEHDTVASGLQVREVLAFTRAHLGDIIVVVLVYLAVSFVAGMLGLLFCGIGILFTSFYVYLVQGHLYGQIGRRESDAAAPDLALPPTSAAPALPDNA